ncbi:DDE-type integrase/transposase/recombinase [bacterium]|nr:DDE-type integrase/transposase/recombinase [bacterium]
MRPADGDRVAWAGAEAPAHGVHSADVVLNWMDFMGDSLADGRTFRTFNLVDDFSREAPAIVVDHSLPGERIVREIDAVVAECDVPGMIVIDNGPEFAGKALDAWAYRHGVKLNFIRPGKPTENARDLLPASDAADAVILHLWQAVQIVIDLGLSACLRFNLGTPDSYGDAFRRLAGAGLLDQNLAARLTRAAGGSRV